MCRIYAVRFTKLLTDSGSVFGANKKEIYLSSVQTVELRFLQTDEKQLTREGRTSPHCSFHPAKILVYASKELCDIFESISSFFMISWKKHWLTIHCLMNASFCQTFAFFLFSSERKQQFKLLVLPLVQYPLISLSVLLLSPCWQGKGLQAQFPVSTKNTKKIQNWPLSLLALELRLFWIVTLHIGNIISFLLQRLNEVLYLIVLSNVCGL